MFLCRIFCKIEEIKNMKWIYMIVILFVGGMLVYYLFIAREAEPGTAMATAQAFMKAAMNNDMEAAKNLCQPGTQSSVEPIISRIQSAKPEKLTIKYSNMNAKPPYRGVLVTFPGAMISMEMLEENGTWKIANITMD